jgi:hypothetical protein
MKILSQLHFLYVHLCFKCIFGFARYIQVKSNLSCSPGAVLTKTDAQAASEHHCGCSMYAWKYTKITFPKDLVACPNSFGAIRNNHLNNFEPINYPDVVPSYLVIWVVYCVLAHLGCIQVSHIPRPFIISIYCTISVWPLLKYNLCYIVSPFVGLWDPNLWV